MRISDWSSDVCSSDLNGKGATTEDYNTGKAMIGTGPYKFVEWVKGDRIVLEANPDYWGGKPQWDRVEFKPISSGPARVAALLAGDRSEEHTSELQSLMRNSYAVFCLKKNKQIN